jgi:hypothetical protein
MRLIFKPEAKSLAVPSTSTRRFPVLALQERVLPGKPVFSILNSTRSVQRCYC